MTAYTVDSNGNLSPTTPAFPQPILNDSVTPDGSYDQTASSQTVFIDGTFQLQSLFVGSAVEIDLGEFSNGMVTGTGSITGSNDTTKILPAFVSLGSSVVDINGAIDIPFTNNALLAVSAGERTDLEGDFSGVSASAVTVAAGGELDLNGLNSDGVSALTSQGILKITAPMTRIVGPTTLVGTVLVQGDATNGAGIGTQIARATGNPNGAYVAALDLRDATLSAPIASLTLGTDATVSLGTSPTSISRLTIAGSATALVPLDVITLNGTLNVTGDKSGVANQVAISEAEFTGGQTIDFTVAATDGGATLRQSVVLDANTTLRNDAKMTIGGTGTTASTIGATAAAANSLFINGTAGQLTIAAGAALSVAAIQNAGAITVAGNATFLQPFTNTGAIDVTAGRLTLQSAVQGAGAITVESGASLAVGAALTQASVSLRTGSTLVLSQPASFASTIAAPAIGANIDFAGINATSATVSNGSIVVTAGSNTYTLAETGLINGTTLAIASDGAGGSLLAVDANDQPHPVAYRFFDSVHGTQFLTTSLTETQSLQATRPDLVFEGVGLAAANPTIDPNAAPVYRFFDTKFGTHFYTSSTTERDSVIATRPDLVSEGTGFYEHNTAQPGDVAVYRYFDSNFGTHFYTSSATERTTIAATRPDLVSEGVSFYAPSNTTMTS